MQFSKLYLKLKKSHIELRDSICCHLEISNETFYSRLRTGNWTKIEKDAISQLLNTDIDVLFPN